MTTWRVEFVLFMGDDEPIDFLEGAPSPHARKVLLRWFKKPQVEAFLYVQHRPSGQSRKAQIQKSGNRLQARIDGEWHSLEGAHKRLKEKLLAEYQSHIGGLRAYGAA